MLAGWTRFVWTKEDSDKLRELWSIGYSTSHIARLMGGMVTRNAIIGRVHRMGLPMRDPSKRRVRRLDGPTRPIERPGTNKVSVEAINWARNAPKPKPKPLPKLIVDADIPAEQRRTIMSVGYHECRWPVGDPLEDTFFFCGAPQRTGSSYCEHHHKRAYRPITATDRGTIELMHRRGIRIVRERYGKAA